MDGLDYKSWRDKKLENYITDIKQCFVEIANPQSLSNAEIKQIKFLSKVNNFALIQTPKTQNYEQDVLAINARLGLINNDKHYFLGERGLAHITKSSDKKQGEFIPYTDKPINWHTDGYYNNEKHRIRAFTLFCVHNADIGGENQWLDIEMLYILLREKNPELTKLLTQNNAMTIPAHIVDNKVVREESKGAIFCKDELSNSVYMRYTQRKKNIVFADGMKEAIDFLDQTLANGSPYHFKYKMQEAQGIINNNVIHTRIGFVDNPNTPRLMLRGRYFVRV